MAPHFLVLVEPLERLFNAGSQGLSTPVGKENQVRGVSEPVGRDMHDPVSRRLSIPVRVAGLGVMLFLLIPAVMV